MADIREEQISMLVRFYNMQAGTSCKVTNEANRKIVGEALSRASDIVELKNYIRENVKTTKGLIDCFEAFNPRKTETTATIEIQPQAQPQQVNSYMGLLEKAVVDLIAQTNAKEIETRIFDNVEDKVRNFIKEEYGTIERKIITTVDTKKVEMEGVQHDKFETVLKFVANNEPVFLTGQAGTGKNVLCKQVAQALGLDFYFSNAVTQEYKITGFTDAMGVFHESQFYKAFKNGGLFMLDEIDASIPEVLVILNAAIANRYFDFPAPIGYVEAHKDFRVIAAGNTFGTGANYEYVGRNQLDMASLDRFAMVKVDYSKAIEMSVASGDAELVDFAEDFRNAAQKSGVRLVLSYRAIGRIAKMKELLSLEDTLNTCLIKGMEKDDLNMIMDSMNNQTSQYFKALKNIKAAM